MRKKIKEKTLRTERKEKQTKSITKSTEID